MLQSGSIDQNQDQTSATGVHGRLLQLPQILAPSQWLLQFRVPPTFRNHDVSFKIKTLPTKDRYR